MFEKLVAFVLLGSLAAAAATETLSDPMRPWAPVPAAVVERIANERYRLSAILYSPERRVAIVNGRALSEGQRLGRARVTRIHRGKVDLEVGNKTLTLALAKSSNTTPTRSPQ